MAKVFSVELNRDTVILKGVLRADAIDEVMKSIDVVCNQARYPSLKVDVTKVETAFGNFLTVLLNRLIYLQHNRIDVTVIGSDKSPIGAQLRRLNFHSFLNPRDKQPRAVRADRPLPIMRFCDADEQGHVIDVMTKALLMQIPGLERGQVRSAQWAISEVTDNVLNHANSVTGGLAYAQINHSLKNIEFVVADSGIGIPRSLGELDAGVALQKAISEGVTRNRETNQGNGLYGTWRLATLSGGVFAIHSQRGLLFVRPDGSVKSNSKAIRYPGTYVLFQIDYSNPDLISEALTFKGRVHEPAYDYIEKEFETQNDEVLRIKLQDHVISVGSRESGKRVSNLINNLLRMSGSARVIIDFSEILMVSSSFADECFGRLIAKVGPAEFFSRVQFENTDEALRAIIDRSVMQRLRYAASAGETD
jgi:anti-sigma regulatory factor (Ser/Thr protein kinase)